MENAIYMVTMMLIPLSIFMSKQENMTAMQQERDIAEILTSSSLFLEMDWAERQQLLHYLVTSYFCPVPDENRRPFEPAL
jgi:hypothetical protein